ncbi:MAG: DMT family transporter [Treponema sp.]|nr:DMT family transporter [Treponema sp.]
MKSIVYALAAAFFYAINVPCSKILLSKVPPVSMDIIAPILLLYGVKFGTSANASLLGNFEIVATTLIALLLFKEKVSWGFENNCTRRLSRKSTYQIVIIKGLCSGTGFLIVSRIVGEAFFDFKLIPLVLLLGFVAYGLSIFTYVRAQKNLGAAKTSAFYAVAPFIGAFLAFVLLGESLSFQYLIALLIMIAGTVLVVISTLKMNNVCRGKI